MRSAGPSLKKDDSLAQPSHGLRAVRPVLLAALLVLVPALGVVTAFGVAPGTAVHEMPQVNVEEAIALPEWATPADDAASYVTDERVLRGDTVAALFDRLGIHDAEALDFLRRDATGRTLFRQLVPGRMLQAQTSGEGRLQALRYFMGPGALLEIRREGARLTARTRALTEAPQLVYKSATIESSLFGATDAAGIPDAIALQIARVFGTDVDFHTDLRKGDRLAVVYEMIHEAGEPIAPGRIVAARFVNGGHTYEAVVFKDDDGNDAYYSPDGRSRAKAFLRSPVEFSRISSGFGGRVHPIFRNWRAHTGVDFAAPQGTRVVASADGQVASAGVRGGYGNAIEIRHAGGITTLYGHLSGFAAGLRAGTRVHQGQVIGYVGHTGWATGPHLHYEFRVAGVYQDPLRVALPKAQPVPVALRPQFDRVAASAHATMELVASATPARFE